jgi:hypothetical protein
MRGYRLYFFQTRDDGDPHIVERREYLCETDALAIATAESAADGRMMELWLGRLREGVGRERSPRAFVTRCGGTARGTLKLGSAFGRFSRRWTPTSTSARPPRRGTGPAGSAIPR